MQEALAEYGVGDFMTPYIDAIAAGEPVPGDIRREVTNLRDAQRSLTGKIIPMAGFAPKPNLYAYFWCNSALHQNLPTMLTFGASGISVLKAPR